MKIQHPFIFTNRDDSCFMEEIVGCLVATLQIYFKVKIDGTDIPKGRFVKGPKINQYAGTKSDLLFNSS